MLKVMAFLILFLWVVKASYKTDVMIPMEEYRNHQTILKQNSKRIFVEKKKAEMFKLIYFHKVVFVNFLLPFLDKNDTQTIFYLFHFLNVKRGYTLPPWHYEAIEINIINIPGIQILYKFQIFQILNKTIFLDPIIFWRHIFIPENTHICFPNSYESSRILKHDRAYVFLNDKICSFEYQRFFHNKGILTKIITFRNEKKFVITDHEYKILAKGEWHFKSDIAELVWEANNLGFKSIIFYKVIFYIQRFCLVYPRYLVFCHEIFIKFTKFVKKHFAIFYKMIILILGFFWYPNVFISLPWMFSVQNCWTRLGISALHANIYFILFSPWSLEMFFCNEGIKKKYQNLVQIFNIEPKTKNNFAIPSLFLKKTYFNSSACQSILLTLSVTCLVTVIFTLLSLFPFYMCSILN